MRGDAWILCGADGQLRAWEIPHAAAPMLRALQLAVMCKGLTDMA